MVTAIILAAGFSSRFGSDKLLTVFEDKPLVQHVMDVVAGLPFEKTVLVYRDEAVKKLAPPTMQCVNNPNSSEGLSSSVKCGLLHCGKTDAFLFFMGDQPFVDEDTVSQLVKAFHDRKGSIIVPLYDGQRGNPVLFDPKWRRELMELTGDSGGRGLIDANSDQVCFIRAVDSKTGRDIDTREQLLEFQDERGE